jgi:hypothetical protein
MKIASIVGAGARIAMIIDFCLSKEEEADR